jgi:DNA polymerase-3 subunit alpha
LREVHPIKYIVDAKPNQKIVVMGVVEEIKRIQTKKGEPMSFVDIIDKTGKISLTLFPETHRRYIKAIDEKDTIIVEGKYENDKYGEKIIVNKVSNAEEAYQQLEANGQTQVKSERLYIRFHSVKKEAKKLEALQALLKEHHGKTPVIVYDESSQKQMAFKKEFFADVHSELLQKLRNMFENDDIVIK